MFKGYLLTNDGASQIYKMEDSNRITLKEAYDFVKTDIIEHIIVNIHDKTYHLWFCEEGKLREKKPTLVFLKDNNVVDYIAGPCLITHEDLESLDENDFESLMLLGTGFVENEEGEHFKVVYVEV